MNFKIFNLELFKNYKETGEFVVKDTALTVQNSKVKLFVNSVSHVSNCTVIGADDSIAIAKGTVKGQFSDNSVLLCEQNCIGTVNLFDNSIAIVADNVKVKNTSSANYITHSQIINNECIFDKEDIDDEFYCVESVSMQHNNIFCVKGINNIKWLVELHIKISDLLYVYKVEPNGGIHIMNVGDTIIKVVEKGKAELTPIFRVYNNIIYKY